MKKTLFFILAAAVFAASCFPAFANPVYNSELEVKSEILYLKSMDDGTVIFDRNGSVRCPPSGLTSIVTALIVLNNVSDPENYSFTVPENINDILAGTDSAVMLLKGGEKIRVIDLLYCILIRSAADASVTLAAGIAGTVEDFVRMMNDYVRELGCVETNFVNVTGLDAEGQYTTASDMAIIMQRASQDKLFCDITSHGTYDFPPTELYGERTVYTTNFMILSGYPDYYYSYITAVKSGATEGSGRCVAVAAAKDGYSYVAVVMKGPYVDTDGDGSKENFAFIDCKKMLSWTFSNIKLRVITDDTRTVAELPVRYSFKTDHIRLVPSQKLSVLMPSSVDADSVDFRVIKDSMPDSVKAPVKKGEVLGRAEIIYGEQVIAEIDLAAAEDISFDVAGFIAGVSKDFITSPIGIALILVIIAVAVVYFVAGVRYDRKLGRFRVVRGGKKTNK